jgi:UDP-glucose 4-epimerase
VPFYRGRAGDAALVARICREHEIEACLHFAGLISVAESVADPDRYRRVNVVESETLIATLEAAEVECFVFSSSAAVYGEPQQIPIAEYHRREPTNPYGATKAEVEDLLAGSGLRSVSLRYFNAAGATTGSRERHDPETHLIPLVLEAAASGTSIGILGTDYPTPDGTAVRDYIHIADLAAAHLLTLDHLRAEGATTVLNLGNGTGFSVREVVRVAEAVTGRRIATDPAPRRLGDPAVLVADSSRAAEVLGWRPRHPYLEEIIGSAWRRRQ